MHVVFSHAMDQGIIHDSSKLCSIGDDYQKEVQILYPFGGTNS